jgi:hypothetical protein
VLRHVPGRLPGHLRRQLHGPRLLKKRPASFCTHPSVDLCTLGGTAPRGGGARPRPWMYLSRAPSEQQPRRTTTATTRPLTRRRGGWTRARPGRPPRLRPRCAPPSPSRRPLEASRSGRDQAGRRSPGPLHRTPASARMSPGTVHPRSGRLGIGLQRPLRRGSRIGFRRPPRSLPAETARCTRRAP